MQKCLKLSLYLGLAIIIGTLLIILTYMLPIKPIRANVAKSTDLLVKEGDYPTYEGIYGFTTLENHTDAMMLNMASYDGSESLVQKSMMNYRLDYGSSPTENLQKAMKNIGGGVREEYSRYWHGYLVILKPLLMVFSYQDIRLINFFVQIMLLLAIVLLLYKKTGKCYVFAFCITILILNPMAISLCLHYSLVYYVTLLTIIILLYKNEWLNLKWERYCIIFMLSGAVTSYCDLSTYPIVSLGLALIVYIILNYDNYIKQLKKSINLSVSWFFGYVGMWVGKWVISTILTKNNVVENGLSAVGLRIGNVSEDSGEVITYIGTLLRQLRIVCNKPVMFLIVITVITILRWCFIERRSVCSFDKNIIYPLLFVSTYPFIWYFFVKNHCFVHPRMEYRALTIMIFSMLCIISNIICEKKG